MVATATTRSLPHADRRGAVRHNPAFGTICRITGRTTGVGLVCDLSRTGVKMLLADPPQVGTVVAAELAPETGGNTVPITIRVIRVSPSETGDYTLGGAFDTPLDEVELQSFITPPIDHPRPISRN